jgi:hypothetical protein
MKNTLLLLAFLIFTGISAQEKKDYSQHVASIDSTVDTLYAVISGNKGEARNWDLFKHLFYKDAKLIATGKNEKKQTTLRYMSSEDYIKFSEKWLMDNGFHELEIKRETQTFGNIAHVFSTYEANNSKNDDTPLMRGINSIQLFNDGKRWWIVNLYWNQESKESPIPEDYLPKSSN